VTGDFTFEAWVKPTSACLTGERVIVAKWDSTGSNCSYRLYLDAGIPKLRLSNDGSTAYTLSGTRKLLADEWTQLAATRNGSTVKILLNSAEDASGTYASSLKSGTAEVRIGADASGSYFAGMIDEVRVASADKTATLGKADVTYTYNARNQLVTETCGLNVRTYSYDKNGNVTKIEEAVDSTVILAENMTYDKLNRMLRHEGPGGVEVFSYRGAEWHRFSQATAAGSKAFLYDGDNVVADIASGVDAFYVTPFLDQNLSITTGGSTYYYSQDGLGSVRTLTDSSGTVKNAYDYLPFGSPYALATTVSVAQRYTYTGRERNPSSDLMYYRYRQYDPRVGRFGGRDPLYPAQPGGDVGTDMASETTRVASAHSSQLVDDIAAELSPYGYARERPTTAIDPSGLWSCRRCCSCPIPDQGVPVMPSVNDTAAGLITPTLADAGRTLDWKIQAVCVGPDPEDTTNDAKCKKLCGCHVIHYFKVRVVKVGPKQTATARFFKRKDHLYCGVCYNHNGTAGPTATWDTKDEDE
jgi:RHS repeat-associated protein